MSEVAAIVGDFAPIGLSVLAVVVSVWSVVSARRTAARQHDLQERLVALETTREADRVREARSAQVRAGNIEMGPGDYRLVVHNDGPATARNVKVLLDGAPALQHRLVVGNEEEISKLGPGVSINDILAVTMGAQRTLDARITWDDDTGEMRDWESELKVV